MTREMAIDVTRVKRTRGGHEVRIYATDGKGLYPIHGAYCNGDWWVMQTWTSDGKVQCGPEGPYDLIEEPRTVELDLWVNVYRDGTTALGTVMSMQKQPHCATALHASTSSEL
jgi:hypothetical protein